MKPKSAAVVLSALLYAQGLLGFAGLATVLLRDRAQADEVAIASNMAIYRELLAERPALAQCFVLVTGDLIGAKAEIEALPVQHRPQILEKPFSTLDVRGVLSAIADQVAAAG